MCTPASGSCGPRNLPGVPAGPRPHCAFMTSLTDRAETGAAHPPGPGSSVEGLGRARGQVRRCRPPPRRPELPARGGVSRRAVAARRVPCLGAGEQRKIKTLPKVVGLLCVSQEPLGSTGGRRAGLIAKPWRPAVPRRKEGGGRLGRTPF